MAHKSGDELEASDAVQIRWVQRAFRSQVRSPIKGQAQGSPANFKLRWQGKSICQVRIKCLVQIGRRERHGVFLLKEHELEVLVLEDLMETEVESSEDGGALIWKRDGLRLNVLELEP